MNPSVPFAPKEKKPLVLCPVALAIGCEKCPLFKPCPLKTILGDQKKGKVRKIYRILKLELDNLIGSFFLGLSYSGFNSRAFS